MKLINSILNNLELIDNDMFDENAKKAMIKTLIAQLKYYIATTKDNSDDN